MKRPLRSIRARSERLVLFLSLTTFAAFNNSAADAAANAETLSTYKQDGYGFKYPQSWGQPNAKKVKAVALASPGDIPDDVAPAHLEVSFSKSKAQLCIYPVKDAMTPAFKKKYQVVTDNVKMLKDMLKKRPTTFKDAPLLPWGDVSTPFFAHVKYLDNERHSDVRFVGQYNTECVEINNEALTYTAQGLTKGDNYYLSLVAPVKSATLPAKDTSATWKNDKYQKFLKSYDSYVLPIGRKLNGAAEESFTPSLAECDEIVKSIETP